MGIKFIHSYHIQNFKSTTLLPAWYTVLVFSKQEENCCKSLKLRQTKVKFSIDDKQRLKNLVTQLLLVMNNSGWQLISHSVFMNWLSFHKLKHSLVAQEKWLNISNDGKINITGKTLKINLLLNFVFYPIFYIWPVSVSSKQHENYKLFLHTDWRTSHNNQPENSDYLSLMIKILVWLLVK
jgi:hypothetical protein